MVSVTVKKQGGEFSRIEIFGHALFDEAGKDIVCAGVSALTFNMINSVEVFTEDSLRVNIAEGITIDFPEVVSKETTLLTDSLLLGLSGIEQRYKDNISIDFLED